MPLTETKNVMNCLSTMRECNGCTACCEGWLSGQAYGHYFQPGRPCHFKCEGGCAIYEKRPENPCKEFICEWIVNSELPEWMKPSVSKVITMKKTWEGGEYLKVIEMGQKIDSVVLNWFFIYHLSTGIPMRIQVNGGMCNYGPPEFLEKFGVSEDKLNQSEEDR